MDVQQINEEVVNSIKPRLDELGFEGFVLVGYVKDSEGKVCRSLVVDGKNDPMIQDALAPMIGAGMIWARTRKPE